MEWHRIAHSAEVTGDGLLSVAFRDHALVVYRDAAGMAHVASAKCPHNGIDLNCNKTAIVDGVITCPLHGWLFDAASGRCTLIPYNPAKTPQDLYLTEYRAEERDGGVLVWWEEPS